MSKHSIYTIRQSFGQAMFFLFSLTFGLMTSAAAQDDKRAADSKETTDRALAWFKRIKDQGFTASLSRIRRNPVQNSFKAEALEKLSAGEQVPLTTKMRARLATLAPVLKFHERDQIVEVRVIDSPCAFVCFQECSVLLISAKAFDLLSEKELQAAVAHEMGHEYFWHEFQEARRNKQYELMREIELRCDGIAVITLDQLGFDPANLISAISRIQTFNLKMMPANSFSYPPPDQGFNFIRQMIELTQEERVAATYLSLK